VNALLLAAGYATRLRPLTENFPKPLLPVGGRPMLDHILDRVRDVPDVQSVHVVTNARFADDFREWARERDVEVHDDGTTSDEDKLGAVGDVDFVVRRAGLEDDDLLVIAGDNLFDFSLADYVDWWRGKDGSAIAVYDVGDLELMRKYAEVELDEDERVVSLVEKPAQPRSTLAAIATYVYARDHVPLVRRYLEEGNSPDAPGNFTAWLYTRAPLYGYRFAGEWRDIGGHEELLEADNRVRRLAGLPERAAYSLD
jgi:glucose-1-phosphate thymidylyltransferase